MGKEILIPTTTSDILCDALRTLESMRIQLTLNGANHDTNIEMAFHTSQISIHRLSQLNVILTSLLSQVTVNCVRTFLMYIQAIVYKPM